MVKNGGPRHRLKTLGSVKSR